MPTIYVQRAQALPKRAAFDFYPTPLSVAQAGLQELPRAFKPDCVLDPGAGAGVWGKAVRQRYSGALIAGVDIRPLERPRDYSFWFTEDFLLMEHPRCFDLVVGNPPYKYGEQFVRAALNMLEPGGYAVFLLRLDFLHSQGRARGIWRQFRPWQVTVCRKRISFYGNGKTGGDAYAFFVWRAGYTGKTTLTWSKTA